MNYTSIQLPSFRIMGIAIRTTNQNNQSIKDIEGLWRRFYQEEILGKIPDKENKDVYCLYTDYEQQADAHYTTIIGCKVSQVKNIPDTFIAKTIPAGHYHLYVSSGRIPESVQKTWEWIWQSGEKRKFRADFDLYSEKSSGAENQAVETYLSVH
ncbi:MAG: GyrI-like domain-containing protein [Chitinophagales bacterium]